MEDKDSILDKVMALNREKAKLNFDPKQIVSELLKTLNDREKEILTKRYSLEGGKKSTLEGIGEKYNITRERVRQIENISIKKIKALGDKIEAINELDGIVNKALEDYLGVLGEKTLIDMILETDKNDETNFHITKFLINKLLDNKYISNKEDDDFDPTYSTKNHDWELFQDVIEKIIAILEKKNQPIHRSELWKAYEDEKDINFKNDKVDSDILLNYLKPSKRIMENPLGEVGLSEWKSIVPKRMSDKIYLVMKKFNRPMHFKEITEEINKMCFDKKIAHPATIHNELILDDKYVLVGRGIYALKKWGYEAGKVSEVVEKTLRELGPVTKEELLAKVLEKKMVKRTTINLAIANNKNIKKGKDGKYYFQENS